MSLPSPGRLHAYARASLGPNATASIVIVLMLSLLSVTPGFVSRAAAAPARRDSPSDQKPRSIIVLLLADPATDLQPGVTHGVIQRELVRQAFLLAARDGLGLATRDGLLRETAPKDVPEKHLIRVVTHFHVGKTGRIAIERGPTGARQVLWETTISLADPGALELVKLTEYAEVLSRKEFVEVLEKVGFPSRPNFLKPEARVPEGTEKLLREMTFTAQFAALQELHAVLRAQGESPLLLGALVRAYANLGMQTELQWSVMHKVFKARALLYAQRLIAREPKSPWGHWHRAYAAALSGLHRAALADLERAAKLRKAQLDSSETAAAQLEAPAWTGLIDAFCRFDTARLAAAADQQYAPLAQLLRFLTIEDYANGNLALKTSETILKDQPECYRIHDSISDLGGVRSRHQTTLAGYRRLTESLAKRLRALPRLPESVAERLGSDSAEPELFRALVEYSRSKEDTAEPSWSLVARLGQDARFILVCRRLAFLHYLLRVPVDEFLQEAKPLVADHPLQPFVETFELDREREGAGLRKLMSRMPLADLDFAQGGILLTHQEIDPRQGMAVANLAMRFMDITFRDYRLLLTYAKAQNNIQAALAQQLLAISPHAPMALATLIDRNWPAVEKRAGELEKGCQHPMILNALGRRYNALRRPRDAERCLTRCLALSPDKATYAALADMYKAEGRVDRWKETLDRFLKEEDYGLDHAQVQVELARYFMGRKEWSQAKPYALAAAQTGAGWAMLCASDYYLGVEDWENSELWVRRAAERYPDAWFRWVYWCKRTGKGDSEGAERLATRYIEQVSGQPTQTDLSEVGAFYTLTKQPKKALEVFSQLYERTHADSIAMFVVVSSDEVGNAAHRDRTLKEFPGKDSPYKRLADLFAACLTQGEKGKLDVEGVDKLLKTMPANLRADACYFIGRFLDRRGDADGALRFWDRSATASEARSQLIQVLAMERLRDRGIEPGKLPERLRSK